MSLPAGLPPLPKILSEDTAEQNSINNGNGRLGGLNLSSRSNSLVSTTCSNSSSTLSSQLAILQREMYDLRKLDLSLYSQLWNLNESLQEYRTILQEQETLSPPSPSDISSEEDDSSSIMSKASQQINSSNPTNPFHTHLQQQQQLQSPSSVPGSQEVPQRMRGAPPPPPRKANASSHYT